VRRTIKNCLILFSRNAPVFFEKPNREFILKVSTDTLLGLNEINFPEEALNIRFTRRLKDLEKLPESKKRAVIKILDEFIKQE